MARAHVHEGKLRGCPVCGTKVEEVQLALRDFSWVNEALPGKVGGMDIDFCLSEASSERVLFIEMKPPGAFLSMGARLTYRVLVRKGDVDAWVVWGPDDNGDVQRGRVDRNGKVQNVEQMTLDDLVEDVAAWWGAALQARESA